jgi:hypothetical protein
VALWQLRRVRKHRAWQQQTQALLLVQLRSSHRRQPLRQQRETAPAPWWLTAGVMQTRGGQARETQTLRLLKPLLVRLLLKLQQLQRQ